MKKVIFALLLSAPALASYSQSESPKTERIKDTLFTKSGFKVAVGDKLKIGTGSMPDGDFKFVRTNSGSLFAYYSTTGYQGLANQANALSRSSSGLEYKVIRIDKRGDKKHGYIYYPIINTGMIRCEVDIDNAIAYGEVVVPDEYKPKPKGTVIVQQNQSLADELLKLKKLYADSVLTKDEYELAKKKLLEKN
jgi:hypothetical protein